MSQAEKVLLRYQYVMDATKASQGDFARTADSVANQTKLLKENLNELATQFGQTLEPTVQGLLSLANQLMPVFSEFVDAIGEIVEAAQPLIDFTIEITKSNLTTILQTVSSILRVMAPVINTISTAVQPILELVNGLLMLPVELLGKVFGSIEELQGNAKEIKFNVSGIAQHYKDIDTSTAIAVQNLEDQVKASARLKTILSGFDELNILNKEDPVEPLGGDEGLKTAEEMDDLIKEWVDWQNKSQDAQDKLNYYYQQGADKLLITREEFEQLWQAYSSKDFTTYYKLLGEMHIDRSYADEVMKQFD